MEINNLSQYRVDKKFLKKVAEKVVNNLKIKMPSISLVLVSDSKIRRLNKNYRGRNKVTDVLTLLPRGR